jgi:hypothetical protein
MTRIAQITTILISIFLFSIEPGNAATRKVNINHSDVTAVANASAGDHELPAPSSKHSQPIAPHKKATGPSMEELPHIHRFHKERVKKIRRYYNKFWALAKFIVVLCHIGLLILGYLHATH